MPFNGVLTRQQSEKMTESLWINPSGVPESVKNLFTEVFSSKSLESKDLPTRAHFAWAEIHKKGWFKNKDGKWVKRKFAAKAKKFQYQKSTPPDPRDGHIHNAAFDEDGNGGTSEAGAIPHVHAIFGFKAQPFYSYSDGKEYVSVHPGSLAFTEKEKKAFSMGECEMEIFRPGTWNDDTFTESDLQEIADNFTALKDEIKPKLKITHHGEETEQIDLAGLASYGDVTEVFMKDTADGKRLFAKLINVPKEVLKWIKDRRFPERSIEIYPEFKVGTSDESPVYKNVLKAIALLGHEMPAVHGMSPIKLQECYECQGTACFVQRYEAAGDTEIVDENRGTDVRTREEIGDDGIVKCSNCGFEVDIETLEADNTGYSQCPQCGIIITRDDVYDAEEMARIESGIKILKSQLEIETITTDLK